MPSNTFATLGLAESLLHTLASERFVEPTPIQPSAILHLLADRDVLGIAQTGTGKTAASVLPILQHLRCTPVRPAQFATRALILVPSRESVVSPQHMPVQAENRPAPRRRRGRSAAGLQPAA